MKTFISAVLLSVSLIASAAASAEVYRLKFNDQTYGGHRTVDIAKAMQKQHRLKTADLDISSVDVIVKSRQGGGQVWLGSRYSQSDRRTAGGTAANFNNPADWTFSRITFAAQNYGSDLQLNLNGDMKLREIRVHASRIDDSDKVLTNSKGEARITLPMHHVKITGLQKLDLKQLLRQEPGVNPDQYHLKGLEVSVKSRQGGGQVWLESGNGISEIQTAGGIVSVFENNNPGSYDRKYFKAAQRNNQASPWLLGFNGDIKIEEIIINLAPR